MLFCKVTKKCQKRRYRAALNYRRIIWREIIIFAPALYVILKNMDTWTVAIERMRVYAYHGVEPQERVVGNEFEVSLAVEVDATDAASGDDVGLTVSYADLAAIVSEEMAQPSQLLEHVAARIRNAVCGRFQAVVAGRVTVAKLTPPMPADVASASVTLRWRH